jgi:phospholipid transport system substrate-binding protein
MRSFTVKTVFVLALSALMLSFAAFTRAEAAAPAEQFISENIQKGMGILNNAALSKDQRKAQFQDFLLGLTNIQAIGRYTLGQYRRAAAPDDLTAFDGAFKDYALSVYQSYFSKYTGQSLKVTGSYALGADETVVKTVTVDAKKSGAKPFEVLFRVKTENGKMLVVDFSVEGIWLRETERSDFTGYLGSHNGDIKQLVAMLKQKAAQNAK